MSALKFRNITASVDDPVETWPFEGILAAVERGTLPDWRRLAAAIRADPWGPVAQQVLEAVEMSRPYGTSELLTTVIERARQEAADAEREQVAGEIRDLVARSGLSQQDFALRLGTSRPRLSTYMSGKVTPSASLMLRMRRVAAREEARDGRQLRGPRLSGAAGVAASPAVRALVAGFAVVERMAWLRAVRKARIAGSPSAPERTPVVSLRCGRPGRARTRAAGGGTAASSRPGITAAACPFSARWTWSSRSDAA